MADERWLIVRESDDFFTETLESHQGLDDAVDSWSRLVAELKVTGDPTVFMALCVYGPISKEKPTADDIPLLSWTTFEPHEALAWIRFRDGTVKHEGISLE